MVTEDRVTQDWLGLGKAIPCVHLHQRWRGGRGKGGLVNPILRDLLRFLAAVTPLLLGLLESGISAAVAQVRYAGSHGVTQDRVTQYLWRERVSLYLPRSDILRRGNFPHGEYCLTLSPMPDVVRKYPVMRSRSYLARKKTLLANPICSDLPVCVHYWRASF